MKSYTHPSVSMHFADPVDLLTASDGLTLKSFILGENDGIGELTEWKG
ncbi:MAG: hypothetical protein SOZ51_09185 [Eubacteriales bacterium]|nr:hypothetical protein [Eubacteriales bacterium]